MSSKQKIFSIIGIVAIIVISFIGGIIIGQKNVAKNDLTASKVYAQTFYAKIESIKQYNDGSYHINVKGLEANNINYRGNFTFRVNDNVDMTWRYEKINISDLKEGNNISITFTDEILNSISPTPLREVIKVQLLDDEISFDVSKRIETIINNGNQLYSNPYDYIKASKQEYDELLKHPKETFEYSIKELVTTSDNNKLENYIKAILCNEINENIKYDFNSANEFLEKYKKYLNESDSVFNDYDVYAKSLLKY